MKLAAKLLLSAISTLGISTTWASESELASADSTLTSLRAALQFQSPLVLEQTRSAPVALISHREREEPHALVHINEGEIKLSAGSASPDPRDSTPQLEAGFDLASPSHHVMELTSPSHDLTALASPQAALRVPPNTPSSLYAAGAHFSGQHKQTLATFNEKDLEEDEVETHKSLRKDHRSSVQSPSADDEGGSESDEDEAASVTQDQLGGDPVDVEPEDESEGDEEDKKSSLEFMAEDALEPHDEDTEGEGTSAGEDPDTFHRLASQEDHAETDPLLEEVEGEGDSKD